MDRIAPSARLEAQIAELLTQGLAVDRERLAELGRLGARLVLQRAGDEEVAAFLSRARTSARGQLPARATGRVRNRSRPPKAKSVSPCPRCATPLSALSVR